MRFLSLSLLAAVAFGAMKYPVQVPSWTPLPFPFSTGMLLCLDGTKSDCKLSISGMQGFDMTAAKPGLVPGGVGNQTLQALNNIEAVALAAHSSSDNFDECFVMLARDPCPGPPNPCLGSKLRSC
tara:strand:- start:911 stop:1285 length:375 start_codon:yes stop_codon:yes gene_type:complete